MNDTKTDSGTHVSDAMAKVREIASGVLAGMGYDLDEELARRGDMPWYSEPGDFRDDNGVLIDCKTNAPKEILYMADDGMPAAFPVVTPEQAEVNASAIETVHERMSRAERLMSECFGSEFGALAGCELAADTDTRLVSIIEDFANSFSGRGGDARGLLFCGPASSGKTHLAAYTASLLVRRGYRGIMSSEYALLDRIREDRTSSRVLDLLSSRDFVVIDELFRTDYGDLVFRVIDRLYNNRVPMIFTTNADARVFSSPDAEHRALCDRIAQRCRIVELSGRNWRQEALAKPA